MNIPDNLIPDYKVPREFIVPLMNHLETPFNELGDRFWSQMGHKDHSAEAIAWWQEVSTSDQMVLSQILASVAAPVLVWECSGYLFSSRSTLMYGIIPDCEDLIAPLFLWDDEDGSSLCVLRKNDRSALLEHITGTLVPAQNTAGTPVSCLLSAEDFFVFCAIIDSLRNALFTSYLHHESVPECINNEQILTLMRDQPYLLDARWALPTALKVTQRWLGDWAGTSIWKNFEALNRMNLITVGEGESNFGLTDTGRIIQRTFLYAITSLCSRISSMTDTGIKTDQYFWTIHSGFCDLLIDLGKFPVQNVTMQSIGQRDLRDRLDIMTLPVSVPPFMARSRCGPSDDQLENEKNS